MTAKIKLLADRNIQGLSYFFEDICEITCVTPDKIHSTLLNRQDSYDALLIRSTCRVDQTLLNAGLQWIGSCVTGTDHIDWKAIQAHKTPPCIITAEGCNTDAVVKYMQAIFEYLQIKPTLRIGILGVGRIGSTIQQWLINRGIQPITCDPFKNTESTFEHIPFEELNSLDVLTCHVPLTREGPYPTYHMFDIDWFSRQSPHLCWINTSRGDIISEAVLGRLTTQRLFLDVWPNEPHVSHEWIQRAEIATPHIAGATQFGLWNGTYHCYQAFCNHFTLPILKELPLGIHNSTHLSIPSYSAEWKALIQNTHATESAMLFKQARQTYIDALS